MTRFYLGEEMPKTGDYWAVLREDAPDAPSWRAIFDGLHVPIVSDKKRMAVLASQPQWVYFLDFGRLPDRAKGRLVVWLSEKFGAPQEEVREEIERAGHPIRSEMVRRVWDYGQRKDGSLPFEEEVRDGR